MKVLSLLLLSFVQGLVDVDNFRSESDLVDFLENTDVKRISAASIEKIVSSLNFDAASLLIRKAHDENFDISVPIRNAVAELRGKLDHLVKLLDPEYFKPQKVPPAFQWTQNDTAVFLQLKYSRRFNAPGAVDVEDFNCTFTNTSLFFSAIGGHSGKRFEYALNLDFFDGIVPELSSWNIGSVGKVLLSIAKRGPSKWPRLLLTTVKIDNMHYWYDFGEKMEASLKMLPIVSESPLTCTSVNQLYCPTSGKCAPDCSECKSKPSAEDGACVGPPAYKPKEVSFTDTDDEYEFVKGVVDVTIAKEYHKFDIDGFNIYMVSSGEALTDESRPSAVSGAITNTTAQADIPRMAVSVSSELVVVPFNARGENREKQMRKSVVDLFKPENCSSIEPVTFQDEDAEERQLKGLLKFSRPANTNNATHFAIHWGKSATEKLTPTAAAIAESSVYVTAHNISSPLTIPRGASHILVFAKSSIGEGSRPVGSWAIEDRRRPKDVVSDLRLLADHRVEFKRSASEWDITGYTVRTEWIDKANRPQTKDVEVVETAGIFSFSNMAKTSETFQNPPSEDLLDGSWKVCVYITNSVGVAREGSCVAIEGPKLNQDDKEL